MAIGLLITASLLSVNMMSYTPSSWWEFLTLKMALIFAISTFIIGRVGATKPNLALIFSSASFSFGILKIVLGVRSLGNIKEPGVRKVASMIYLVVEFILAFFFVFFPIFLYME